MTPDEQLALLRRGADEIISEPELAKKLALGRPLRVKYGADPSAPDLHVGHSVPIRKLRQFQDLGHQVVFLIGDFTARIGDPSQRSETRKMMTRDEVLANAKTYEEQIYKILDPEKTEIAFNSTWCEAMKFQDVLELTAKHTVARMLERDDFEKRYRGNIPISIVEFLYPLVQAVDSVALKADVEMGGTDQKFNMLAARDIQRQYGQEPQVVVTMPILAGTDGVRKMSKSYGNGIGINEPAGEIFGKVMSIPDTLMREYFVLLTEVPEAEIEQLLAGHPRAAKARLARAVTARYQGAAAADEAAAAFDRVHRDHEAPAEMPTVALAPGDVKDGRVWIVRLVVKAGFAASNGEARRLVRQGAVSLDGAKVADADADIAVDGSPVLQVGKRHFARVTFPREA
jgi:tyrosyl-tRNA synthetase